jgi:hypothetical protein
MAQQLLAYQEGIRFIEYVRLLELFDLTVFVPHFDKETLLYFMFPSEHQAVSPPLLLGIMATRFANGSLEVRIESQDTYLAAATH